MRSFFQCFCPAQSREWGRRHMRRPPKYSPGPRIYMSAFRHRPAAHAQTLKRISRPLASPEVNEKHTVLKSKIIFFYLMKTNLEPRLQAGRV